MIVVCIRNKEEALSRVNGKTVKTGYYRTLPITVGKMYEATYPVWNEFVTKSEYVIDSKYLDADPHRYGNSLDWEFFRTATELEEKEFLRDKALRELLNEEEGETYE